MCQQICINNLCHCQPCRFEKRSLTCIGNSFVRRVLKCLRCMLQHKFALHSIYMMFELKNRAVKPSIGYRSRLALNI